MAHLTALVAQTAADRVVTVVLDRAHARFFEVTSAGTVELTSLQSPAMRGGRFHSDRQGGPGWGEHDYHDRRREEARRHYRAIAAQLERLQDAHGTTAFVLAGPGGTGEVLRRSFPRVLAARVIGTAKLNPTEVTPAAVQAVTAALWRQHERDDERVLVAAMLEGLGTGRAENGLRAVLRALAKGQVRVLLLRGDMHASMRDIIREAAVEARRQGATVTVVKDAQSAREIDGLAALLRFS